MAIIECVPNFSEGRDRRVVHAIAEAAGGIPGVKVVDWTLDPDHNRSVLTIIGEKDHVISAALAASERALDLIDMRTHSGVHPRIGAVDVVPFIPLKGASMETAVQSAHTFGRKLAGRRGVPVYFYGEAAQSPDRKRLANIRKGGYESLPERLTDPSRRPDEGPVSFNPAAGATAVGARKPLVAFNVDLESDNLEIARTIARTIRQSSGGFDHVQAIGIALESRGIVQVSMNLTDCDRTPIIAVYERIKEEARKLGVEILESELIGLMPKSALAGTTAEYCRIRDFSDERFIEYYL